MQLKRSATFSLLKFLLIVFAIFGSIDAIFHLVKAGANKHEDNANTPLLYLMSFRIVVSFIAIFVTFREYVINPYITILVSFVYGVILAIILFVTSVLIDYRHWTLSFIVQTIAAYVGLAVAYKLLILKHARIGREEKERQRIAKQSSKRDEKSTKVTFESVLRAIDNNILAVSTFLMVSAALALGVMMKEAYPPKWDDRSVMYINYVGEIFFRILKCLVLPLIFTSLVFAMANIDAKLLGRVGFRTFCYYITTTVIAIILGIVLVLVIKPGKLADTDDADDLTDIGTKSTTVDSILDLIRNIFPDNIITACFQTYKTVLVNNTNDSDVYNWSMQTEYTNSTNILGIVVFAMVFGIIIGQMPKDDREVLHNFFRSFFNGIMKITTIVVQLTPIAVFFLVLPQVLKVENVSKLIGSVGYFTLTTIAGLLIHGFLVYPLLYFAFTRKNPYTFLANMSAAIMTALGTSSSSVTMPITIQCLEERNRIDKRIVRFCVPLGASINMDGGALYYATAAIFISQYYNMELSFASIIILAIISTAVSVGAAGIPTAGPVTIMIILNSVDLPIEASGLVFMVDWILDRFETAINIMGDSFGAAIVHQLSKEDLESQSLSLVSY